MLIRNRFKEHAIVYPRRKRTHCDRQHANYLNKVGKSFADCCHNFRHKHINLYGCDKLNDILSPY